jgi:hypothetical protein
MADMTSLTPKTIETAVRSVFDFEIASNACQKYPLLGWLISRYGKKTKNGKGIGIPDDGILGGLSIPAAERKEIKSHTWEPAIHTGLPADLTKRMAWYDTTPTDTTGGAAGGLSRIQRPKFRRTDYTSPIVLAKRDLDTLKVAYGKAVAEGNTPMADAIANDVTDLATIQAVEVMVNQIGSINSDLWAISSDYPTDESLLLWDKQHSLHSMCGTDNSYGGVDRALAANAHWRGNKVTTKLPADISYLFNFVQYNGLGLNNKANRPNLWTCGNVIFPIFKDQAIARNLKVYSGDEIPDVPVYGQKQEAIKINNDTYIINDPSCPTAGVNGATKNALVMLSTDKMLFSFFGDNSFKVDKFFDQSKILGSAQALTSTLTTILGIWTKQPWSHVWLDDVGG